MKVSVGKKETLQTLRKKPIVIGISSILTIAVVASGVLLWQQRQSSNALTSQQTAVVQQQDLASEILAGGVVQAVRSTNLSPEGSGKIAELFIQEGDRVTQGQVVARMVNRRSQAEVAQAEAAVAQAQADLNQRQFGARNEDIVQAQARVDAARAAVEVTQASLNRAQNELSRFQQLADRGAVSQNELETYRTTVIQSEANLNADEQRLSEAQAALAALNNGTRPEEIAQGEAALAQAEARLAAVQIDLEETTLRAPFDGIITRRFAETGDFVTPTTAASSDDGATSTSIAELSSGLEIDAKIPEASIAKLAVGQTAEIISAAYPDEVFEGEIKLIAPRATREERVTFFQVKVAITTGQNLLRSGMTVRLTFLGNPIDNALVIPLAALVTQPEGEQGVYLAGGGDTPTFRPVDVGVVTGAQVQVLSGVKEGDRILIEPPPGQTIEGVDTITDF
ncbi:MAG: efflux RND transporter periplasmic adaptor subunit [Cyanobacteria bacterium P01_D01_bin.36]